LREQAKKMNVTSLRSNDDSAKVSAEIRIAKVYKTSKNACKEVDNLYLKWFIPIFKGGND